MHTFSSLLREATQVYDFKIKLAEIEPTDEVLTRIEHALKAFDLDRISKPKHLPFKDRSLDFPNFGLVDVYLITASLKYPCTDEQLRTTVSVQGRIPLANIVVTSINHPEEILRDLEERTALEAKKKAALLDTEKLEAESGQELVGQSRLTGLLKELESRKYKIEGEETKSPETTNDLPMGDKSPVGSVAIKHKDFRKDTK